MPPYRRKDRLSKTGNTKPWIHSLLLLKHEHERMEREDNFCPYEFHERHKRRSRIPVIRDSHLEIIRRELPNPLAEIAKKWEDPKTFAPNP